LYWINKLKGTFVAVYIYNHIVSQFDLNRMALALQMPSCTAIICDAIQSGKSFLGVEDEARQQEADNC
jgi:hypothetical protein